jgi:hypothetical protein
MTNVFDFPVADRPITEDQQDKLHSQAFRDLEGRLCDCVRMAHIAGIWPRTQRTSTKI